VHDVEVAILGEQLQIAADGLVRNAKNAASSPTLTDPAARRRCTISL
jgi:hypothetical protein